MKKKHSFLKNSQAFTLVEMLAVVAVVALILAAVAPMVFSTLLATKLTTAGDALMGQVSLARQIAVSRNREIEMRIYSYVDPEMVGSEPVVKAVVLVETPDLVNTAATVGVAVAETYYLPSGIAIARDPNLSPILSQGGSAKNDQERFIRKAQNATYRSVRFLPDGSTSINLPANRSYFTIGDDRLLGANSGGKVPDNFYAIQIDPVTGRARAYRPGA
jgi:uncharacterized protein (TIGR02596 family)